MKIFRYITFLLMLSLFSINGYAQPKPKPKIKKDKKIEIPSKVPTQDNDKKPVRHHEHNGNNHRRQVNTKSYFSITPQEVEFTSSGGARSFVVKSSKRWKISTDTYNWGHLQVDGDVITLKVDSNPSVEQRIDYFEIESGTKKIVVDITQAGRDPKPLRVSKTDYSFEPKGGTATLDVYSDISWDYAEVPSWIHVVRNGTGNTLSIRADENYFTSSRSGSFVVRAGSEKKSIFIRQGGAPKLEISKKEMTFFSYGGSQTINVESTNTWFISENLSSMGTAYKSGNQLVVTVNNNTNTSTRSERIVIKSGNLTKTIEVYQNAAYYQAPKPSVSENWWKGRVSFGWHLIGIEGEKEAMSFRTGLRLRFGKPKDFFNFIIGADYAYHTSMEEFTVNLDELELEPLTSQVCVNANLRFNIIPLSRNNRIYIGCEGDYAFKVSNKFLYKNLVNDNSISLAPQIGFNFKHFDLGFEYRRYLDDKGILCDGLLEKGRFGGYMVVYF